MERAVERDPLNPFWRGTLASHLTIAGRFEEALRHAREAIALDSTNVVPVFNVGASYATLGRWTEARELLERAHELVPTDAMTAGLLAGVLVRLADRDRANTLIREMGESPCPPIGRVLYHLLASEMDEAARWYEHAINGRDPFALVFASGPFLHESRQTSHWRRLASMMKLTTG